MPVVPRYERQVAPRPAPDTSLNVRVPKTPGPERTIQQAEQIFQREYDEANKTAVLDATRKSTQFSIDLQHDPETGLLNRKGSAVNGIIDEAQQAWEAHVAETEATLTNDAQRRAYRTQASARWFEIDSAVKRYTVKENERYAKETVSLFGQSELEYAAANWEDSDKVDFSIQRQYAALTDYAAAHVSEDERGLFLQNAKLAASSATHRVVLLKMLANDQAGRAKEYYAEHGKEISKNDSEFLDPRIKERSDAELEARVARDLYAEHGPQDDNDVVQLDELLETVTGTADLKTQDQRDRVRARLKERVTIHNAARKERIEANQGAVLAAFDEGTSLDELMSMEEYLALPDTERHTLRAQLLKATEQTEATQDINLSRLLSDAKVLRETSMKELENMRLSKQLSGAGFKEAVSAKQELDESPAHTNFGTLQAQTKALWVSMGLDTKKGSDGERFLAQFNAEVQNRVYDYEKIVLGGKRKASFEERREIISDVAMSNFLADVDLSSWPMGTTEVPLGEVKPGEKAEGVRMREAPPKRITRTGTLPDGRRVVQYSDGSVKYAD